MCLVCTNCEVLLCFALHWECQSLAVRLACNLSPITLTKMLWVYIWNKRGLQLCQDLSRTISDLGRPSVPTSLVSMVLSATWWALYRSCLRSTWLWKRGCFLTGSSGPNCGETTLITGVKESEKIKGLNIDLAGYGWGGWTGRGTGKKEAKSQKQSLKVEAACRKSKVQEGENIEVKTVKKEPWKLFGNY